MKNCKILGRNGADSLRRKDGILAAPGGAQAALGGATQRSNDVIPYLGKIGTARRLQRRQPPFRLKGTPNMMQFLIAVYHRQWSTSDGVPITCVGVTIT